MLGVKEPQVKEATRSFPKCPICTCQFIPTSRDSLMSFLESSAHSETQRFPYPLALPSACGLSPPPWTSKLHIRAIASR